MKTDFYITMDKNALIDIVEDYIIRIDSYWTGVLRREVAERKERLTRNRWLIGPILPNATDDEVRAYLINDWDSTYNHWNRQYGRRKEDAEILLQMINKSVNQEIEIPYKMFRVLVKEKLSGSNSLLIN